MTATSNSQGPPVTLPDGTVFQFWRDETVYGQVYYVDQQHPGAADDNAGTEEAPFLTIQAAAELVEPGQKILIKSGVYRELVQPRRGGTGADSMISYEAAPGAEVVIRGSQVIDATWTHTDGASRSLSVWTAELSEIFFAHDHPFAVVNTTEADFELMRWAEAERGRAPHTLPRAMVFQNGRRLTQFGSCDELPRVPGAFWIDAEHRKLHVNPFDRQNPNTCEIEATTQQYLFNPLIRGLGYLRLAGLTFEQAGNGFIRSGNGAVTSWGGHHWIIEDNTVRHINSVGVEIGGYTDESSEDEKRSDLAETTGGHLVRRNHVHDCGTGGIQGTVVPRSLVADNHVHDCGWQEVERYWETAGIKILILTDTVVQCNHIHHCHAAPGIWIDFVNKNSRVTRNLVHDIASTSGGIFFEASDAANMIDHNVIYNVEAGSGIYQQDCDQLLIAHNLVLNCDHAGIHMRKCPTRDRVGVCKDNRIINNVIVGCPKGFEYVVMDNVSDYNVLANMGEDFSLDDWQATGLDAHSRVVELDMAIDAEEQHLAWSGPVDAVPKVIRDELLSLDYFGRPYPEEKVPVGPFTEGWGPAGRQLRLR
jgi:hypothetical protein